MRVYTKRVTLVVAIALAMVAISLLTNHCGAATSALNSSRSIGLDTAITIAESNEELEFLVDYPAEITRMLLVGQAHPAPIAVVHPGPVPCFPRTRTCLPRGKTGKPIPETRGLFKRSH